jgi:hypothetical protein
MQILTGGSITDGSTQEKGTTGCFDKSSIAADAGSWSVVDGPYTIGSGTTLTGCSNAQSSAGVNTQTDSDKCEVTVNVAASQYVRIQFLGTYGNDNYMELRQIKVYGSSR